MKKSADQADSAVAMSSWLVAMRYVCSTFTIFSNGSIILPGFKFTELHALTLVARSYALLPILIKSFSRKIYSVVLLQEVLITVGHNSHGQLTPLCEVYHIYASWHQICSF